MFFVLDNTYSYLPHNKFLWEEVDKFVHFMAVKHQLFGSSGTSFH